MDAVQPIAEMERLLEKNEVARLIGWDPNTLRRKVNSGDFIKPLYLGRNPRWRMKDIVAWIDEQAAKRDA